MNQEINSCYKPETDIFTPPSVQTAVEEGSWIKVNPLSGFETGTIEFDVVDTDEYVDLNETEFRAQISLRKINPTDETKTEAVAFSDKIGVVNNLLHSMFDQITVSLNNTQVENSNGSYAYRAYFEKLLNYGKDAKDTHLFSSLFIKDTAGEMDNTSIPTEPAIKEVQTNLGLNTTTTPHSITGEKFNVLQHLPDQHSNHGYIKRRNFLISKKSIELCDRLHIDLFNTNRYLLNKVGIKVKMERSKNSFVLLGDRAESASKYVLYIEKCCLFIRKVKLSASIMADHIKTLQTTNALYPIRRVIVKNYTIPKNVSSETIDNIYVGKMPRRIVVGFVKHTAFNGLLHENPFNFQHFNVERLKLSVAGHPLPYRDDLTFDYGSNQYMRGFNTLYKGLYRSLYETGNDITYNDFSKGFALYAFNTTPDLCDSEHTSLPLSGELQLEVKFQTPTEDNLTAIFYLEFDNTIQINYMRQILFDYKV